MAREFDEQIESTNPDSGSNPADDSEALNVDEQLDLIALTWLGRG